MQAESKLVIIPDATHLFKGPGKLDEVADYASARFQQHWGA